MEPHPQRAGRFNKKCSTSIHNNTVDNESLCFYAVSGSNKRFVQTAVIEYLKNKDYITESSRNVCNICLSKVKVEFCNMQPGTSLEESAKSEEQIFFPKIIYLFLTQLCNKIDEDTKELLNDCSFDMNDLKHDQQSCLQKIPASLVELILTLSCILTEINDLLNK